MTDEVKRVVVWGTGFVGKMVIPEILRHPAFELVGVGVNNPEKVGTDVGEICGSAPVGMAATNDIDALVALRPDAVVHFGPTAARQHPGHRRLSPGRHRCVLDGDDAVGVADHAPQPPELDRTDRRGLPGRRCVVLHHRDRPGVRQRPVSDDTHGSV
jgi:hypothetical protein